MTVTVTEPAFTISRKAIFKRALKELKLMRAYQQELKEETRALAKDGWARPNYCKHGTFIGDPYGADYLCWACESGESDHSIALGTAHAEASRAQANIHKELVFVDIWAQQIVDNKGDVAKIAYLVRLIDEAMAEIEKIQEKWE